MARGRPTLCAEDAKALTLLMSPAADEFTIALDRCGWMIVPQPQFGDRRWFMNHPSDVCPKWADNDVPEEPPAARSRLRVIDGGKNEALLDWASKPERVGQLQIVQFLPTADGSDARRNW